MRRPIPTVVEFYGPVVKGAALHGTPETVDFLLSLIDGQPVRYTQMTTSQEEIRKE